MFDFFWPRSQLNRIEQRLTRIEQALVHLADILTAQDAQRIRDATTALQQSADKLKQSVNANQ